MTQAVANAQNKDALKHRKELAVRGFEKALENMRELAEITADPRTRPLPRSKSGWRKASRNCAIWEKASERGVHQA